MHFLEKLSRKVLEDKSLDLQNLIIILPNVRARVFLNDHLKNLADKAIFLPIAYSSPELMEKLSGLESADDYLLLSRLYNAYPLEKDEDLSFELFMNWGSSILQDFKEIDHQLVNENQLFTEIQDVKRLEFWNVQDGHLSDFQKKYLTFCEKLSEIYQKFASTMKEDGIAHLGYLERTSFDNLSPNIFKENSEIIIAGFNALTKAEEKIFKFISDNFRTSFYWDYDEYYLKNELHEAGYFGRINRKKFANNFNWIANDFKEINKQMDVHKCSTSFEQSFVVSEILKSTEQKDLIKTAIILPDESLLLPVLQALPHKIKDINVTMGYPLSHSPYHSLFEEIINLLANSRKRDKSLLFYHKDVFRLLNSESIKEMLEESFNDIVNPFLHSILSSKLIFVPSELLNDVLHKIFYYQKIDLGHEKRSIDLMTTFQNVIFNIDHKLLEKNDLSNKISREFLLHHFEVVNQAKDMLKNLAGNIDLNTLHKIWKHYSKLSKVQFTGEPLKGIQVMGLLESRNLDFDHVIILNANEGTLPSEKRYGSLIPNDLKRGHQMHLHKEKDAVISYHFYRLLQRAKKVDLLYTSQTDNLGGGEKSRFIVQLEKELLEHNSNHKINFHTAVSSINIASPSLSFIQKTGFINQLIKEKLKSGLSPTSISTYIRCPLDFYFLELVGLKNRQEMIEKVESNILGSAIHDTLEYLYRPLIGKTLSKEHILSMKKTLKQNLKKAFSKYLDEKYLLKGKNLLDYKMAEKIVLRHLEKEEKYVSNNKIELLDLEVRVDKDFELEFDGEKFPVKIKGIVDRVEKKNGLLNLIDYKTGGLKDRELNLSEISQAFEGRDKILQLLIYSWLYNKDESDVSIAICPLKKYAIDYVPVVLDGNEILENRNFEEFEKEMKAFIIDMLSSTQDLSHNELSLYCDYC